MSQRAVIGEPSPVSRCTVRVRFGETDLMGIVHHASYLSYFEVARVEYLRRRGIEYATWAARGVHLPVIEARLKYRQSARFDEELAIDTTIDKLTRVTVGFAYRVLRTSKDREQLLAEGMTLLACVGETHKPRRIPPDLADALRAPEVAPTD